MPAWRKMEAIVSRNRTSGSTTGTTSLLRSRLDACASVSVADKIRRGSCYQPPILTAVGSFARVGPTPGLPSLMRWLGDFQRAD
jgi:hypothetical protein